MTIILSIKKSQTAILDVSATDTKDMETKRVVKDHTMNMKKKEDKS